MAEIILFPNPLSSTSVEIHDPQVPAQLSGDPEMDQMLRARARIRSVLDELDRLSGELEACSLSTRA
ncbi:hypothetical protein [Rhizobium leguminosarum]|uniref:Uncharacterized protein n=1 Tax=Rhizobium leguminosarum TaxID=384 RepID=A0A7X0DSN3_RHILE|nr:hypothetical protein [Rhizobium leguminosarum]MBB6219702.1 hypothetical protein [Rhizobium leguminosarum]